MEHSYRHGYQNRGNPHGESIPYLIVIIYAVRIIENAKTASHTDPLFFKYKILKLNDLTESNHATFMNNYTKTLLPSSFNNTFKKLGNFERSLNYQIDILNTGSLEYLPSYALLKIWNKLPLDLKRSALLVIFKITLFKMLSDA